MGVITKLLNKPKGTANQAKREARCASLTSLLGVAEIFDARRGGRFAYGKRMQAREMRAVPPQIWHRLEKQRGDCSCESRCALEKAQANAAARANVERRETRRRGVANQNRRLERTARQSLRDQARKVGAPPRKSRRNLSRTARRSRD